MELKYQLKTSMIDLQPSFNRTFMELKLQYVALQDVFKQVLIVPLWNWNAEGAATGFTEAAVLIVPLWNWNLAKATFDAANNSVLIVPLWNWNKRSVAWTDTGVFVLIVPLWNWNTAKVHYPMYLEKMF